MKLNSIFFFMLFSITFLFNNCTPTQYEILEKYCEDKKFDISLNEKIVVVLIPVDGCSACISKSLDFINIHPKYPYHYVLSSVLRQNLEFVSSQLSPKPDKVFYDFENTLMMHNLVYQIPKAFIIYQNKIIFSLELGTEENYLEFNEKIDENFSFN